MKNLEEEYKNSQQEEMPDLWNRIEAGLPEKKKPLPFLSATRYLKLGAAAAALLLLISLGLWSGRQFSSKNASDMSMNMSMSMDMQNEAGSPIYNNSNMAANDTALWLAENETAMENTESVDYDMAEESTQQTPGINDPVTAPILSDDASLESMLSGESMPSEETDMEKSTALSEVEALALLGAYLEETGILSANKELYGTGEGEVPGYTWKSMDAGGKETVRMFLEFDSLTEDGSYLLFRMGELDENGGEEILWCIFSVHVLTGAIAVQ
ncbi:MAG: hypothetical protein J1E83_05280 [Lachnospiraceae bacterium]|nr:hypothetical protein [Lachnospiraceae bacterium]